MNSCNGHPEDNVAKALAATAGPVAEKGPGRWSLSLWNGAVHAVQARLDDDWLGMQAAAGDGLPTPWDLLRRNAGLAGLTRFTLQGSHGVVTLRAEMPADGNDLVAELQNTLQGFRQALGLAPDTKDTESSPADGPSLARRCSEAGWPFEERQDGSLIVDLETPGTPLHARLETATDGGLWVNAPLLRAGNLTEAGRQAVATVLLATSATVRMARACATASNKEVQAGFEVRLSAAAEPATLNHALAALSVSCGLCVLEARALQEESLAQQYLELRGYAPDSLSQPDCRSGAGGL